MNCFSIFNHFLGSQKENRDMGEFMIAYDDDVAIAPRDLVTAAEERADGLEELADRGLHSFLVTEIQDSELCGVKTGNLKGGGEKRGFTFRCFIYRFGRF